MKKKVFFITFEGLSIKQMIQFFLERESPTLNLNIQINNLKFSIDSIALHISTVIPNYLKVTEKTKFKNGRLINKSTVCPGFINSWFCLKETTK